MTSKDVSKPPTPKLWDLSDPHNLALGSQPPDPPSDQEDKDAPATAAIPDSPTRTTSSGNKLDPSASRETAEDIDLLIAELEEEDGNEPEQEVIGIAIAQHSGYHAGLLETDLNLGLNDAEVIAARRKYGRNRLKQEHQNNLLKFFKLFVGPVQFVMEVCNHAYAQSLSCDACESILIKNLNRPPPSWLPECGIGLTSGSSAPC